MFIVTKVIYQNQNKNRQKVPIFSAIALPQSKIRTPVIAWTGQLP